MHANIQLSRTFVSWTYTKYQIALNFYYLQPCRMQTGHKLYAWLAPKVKLGFPPLVFTARKHGP